MSAPKPPPLAVLARSLGMSEDALRRRGEQYRRYCVEGLSASRAGSSLTLRDVTATPNSASARHLRCGPCFASPGGGRPLERLTRHFTMLSADGDDARSPLHDGPMDIEVRRWRDGDDLDVMRHV